MLVLTFESKYSFHMDSSNIFLNLAVNIFILSPLKCFVHVNLPV